MESMNPCLSFVFEIKKAIAAGESPRQSIKKWCEDSGDFNKQVELWLIAYEKGGDCDHLIESMDSIYRKSALRLLKKSFEGHAIQTALDELEQEVILACREEMDQYIATLPYKLMIPVLCLILPSLLLLIFGTLLSSFSKSLNGF